MKIIFLCKISSNHVIYNDLQSSKSSVLALKLLWLTAIIELLGLMRNKTKFEYGLEAGSVEITKRRGEM